MIMKTVIAARRLIIPVILFPLVSFLVEAPSFAQEASKEEGGPSHVDWRLEGEEIIITYDLEGKPSTSYDITIAFINSKDPSFGKVIPKSVRGDVGEVASPGRGKKIWWDFKRDGFKELDGDGYSFVITAEPAGSGPWLYIAAGAVVGGGVAYFLLGKKAERESESPLPSPPALRPF